MKQKKKERKKGQVRACVGHNREALDEVYFMIGGGTISHGPALPNLPNVYQCSMSVHHHSQVTTRLFIS